LTLLADADFSGLIARLPPELRPQAAPGTWEVALAQLPSGGKVLCAGAGRGGLSQVLVQAGYDVESADLHADHFVAPGLSCRQVDFLQPLPYADGEFDVVLVVEVVEHLENPWSFLREAVRALRADGLLVFTTPNVDSLASRMTFARKGLLPYFRDESFFGCYHVTPIFRWAVERWCTTTTASIRNVAYSRANWPTATDVPRYERGVTRRLKELLPVNEMTGEIACYTIVKTGAQTLAVGTHYR